MSLVVVAAEARRYDDEALVHLANRGLLRRASKLVDPPPVVSEAASGLVTVAGDGWAVEFEPGGPLAQGRCGCSTNGVCQHLVAAILTLRGVAEDAASEAGANAEAPDVDTNAVDNTAGDTEVDAELVELSNDELTSMFNRSELRWALDRLASLDPVQVAIDRGPASLVDLPPPHGSVRFLGPTPSAAVVKPSTRHDKRVVLLALLVLRADAGREPPTIDVPSDRPVNELLEERLAVVGRARVLCSTLIRIGLLHLGDGEREQLDSLAASARGAKLYRLSVLAERASDQLVALEERSPEGDTRKAFGQLAEIAAVSEAIERALLAGRPLSTGLAGEARSSYEAVGRLDLAVVGHYSWGDARFAGSTGVLMESSDRTYTVSRPHLVGGRHLDATAGWTGVGSVAALAGRRVTLFAAQASRDLKLSSSASTTAEAGATLTAEDFDSLSWHGDPPETGSRLLGRSGSGWRVLPIDDQDEATRFDPITQRMEWSISSCERRVDLSVPYRAGGSRIVDNLERLVPTGGIRHVVGRMRARGGALTVWPVAVFTDTLVLLDREQAEPDRKGVLGSLVDSLGLRNSDRGSPAGGGAARRRCRPSARPGRTARSPAPPAGGAGSAPELRCRPPTVGCHRTIVGPRVPGRHRGAG